MNDKHDISVLNGLITTTLDSMKGFEDAAEDAKSTRFAAYPLLSGAIRLGCRAAIALSKRI